MTLQVEILDLRRMLKEKCEEIITDKKLAYEFYCRMCEIEEDDRFTIVDDSQEARILDLDELEDWDNAVWFEDKDEQDCYIVLIANVSTYDASFVNVEPGKFTRLDWLREFYKKEWRCWTARPTDEQRMNTPWEGR